MGKWLDKFSADIHESLPDIPDILPSVSGLSGPDLETSAKNIHPHEEAVIEGASPTPPLHPGWLVVYRDRRGALCGGCDDRQHGTVQECRLEGNGWMVHLTDGQKLPLSMIRSVGHTNAEGHLVAAWTTREHGYDGAGSATRGGQG